MFRLSNPPPIIDDHGGVNIWPWWHINMDISKNFFLCKEPIGKEGFQYGCARKRAPPWCRYRRNFYGRRQKYRNFPYFRERYMCLMGVDQNFFYPCENPLAMKFILRKKMISSIYGYQDIHRLMIQLANIIAGGVSITLWYPPIFYVVFKIFHKFPTGEKFLPLRSW